MMTNQQIATAIKQRRLGFTWRGLARRYGVAESELMQAVADYHREKLRRRARGNRFRRQRARAARNRAIADLLREGVRVPTIAKHCGLSVRTIQKIRANLTK